MFWYDMMSELDLLSMKMTWLNWWCNYFVIEWLWVQTLENQTKNIIFGIQFKRRNSRAALRKIG